MSELLKLQIEFAKFMPRLLDKAAELYDGVTLGECSRSDEQAEINALGARGRAELVAYLREAGSAWELLARAIENNRGSGIRRTLHALSLAIDLKAFRFEPIESRLAYLTLSMSYMPLGEWWEKQHPLARWGGRFGDGGHFSFEYRGIK